MISTLTPLIPEIFLRLLVASVVGIGSYLSWRFLEKKWQPIIPISAVLLILFGFIYLVGLAATYFPYIAVSCILGLLFHQKSGGKSATKFQSFLFTFVASFSITALALTLDKYTFHHSFGDYLSSWYYFGVIVYPSLTPFLIWAWKNSRLSPGIDKNFDE